MENINLNRYASGLQLELLKNRWTSKKLDDGYYPSSELTERGTLRKGGALEALRDSLIAWAAADRAQAAPDMGAVIARAGYVLAIYSSDSDEMSAGRKADLRALRDCAIKLSRKPSPAAKRIRADIAAAKREMQRIADAAATVYGDDAEAVAEYLEHSMDYGQHVQLLADLDQEIKDLKAAGLDYSYQTSAASAGEWRKAVEDFAAERLAEGIIFKVLNPAGFAGNRQARRRAEAMARAEAHDLYVSNRGDWAAALSVRLSDRAKHAMREGKAASAWGLSSTAFDVAELAASLAGSDAVALGIATQCSKRAESIGAAANVALHAPAAEAPTEETAA